ncbi:MAG TPA: hydrogenase formation protein HypD [Candidatus Omnitrophota bacterium]|nr:hydrogenase formation protein HypD [Candidatus Omnitrophota bacterium]HQJ16104.1 hydrogenase formation protein HypD [Candidatus Omnitrophota bacterium]
MRYIDEFRDRGLVKGLVRDIESASTRKTNLMEVCGTHTMAIFRSGIRRILPASVNLISGPGCPVCVTSQSDIDRMLYLAGRKDTIITTFGDMLKVPGTESSLEKKHASGADIRIVYSPLDALAIAEANPRKKIVFLAVGFETTAPIIASVISDAAEKKISNFFVYCCHKTIPAAMKALLETREIRIDGFLCPGHVSSIIGSRAYEFIARDFNVPCAISGFEPTDILETILMLIRQKKDGRACVEIQYKRAVQEQGNVKAKEMMDRVFEPSDGDWRGLGVIHDSGLKIRKAYRFFDATAEFRIPALQAKEPRGCACAEVLRGIKTPRQCGLFAKTCTPETPFGPCMVSTEGTCAAWFKYNRN